MKILIDSGYPKRLHEMANVEGLELIRVTGRLGDRDLIRLAAEEGFRAVLLLDQEILASESLQDLARDLGVVLICSVTDDPFEAEANFRHSLSTLASRVRTAAGPVLWLRKDGIREPSQTGR